MQLTLRSQLIAGVAAFGVSALAVAPVVQPQLLPTAERIQAAVDLVSVANPVTVLLATLDEAVFSTFDQAALPSPEDLYWPDSFYTADFSFLFSPGYEGVIPDFLNQSSNGALSAVGSNLSGYISALGYGLNQIVSGPADAIWNTPFALVTAAGYVLAGQIDLALAELQSQIIDPLVSGISGALQAVGYVVDNSIANAATLLANTVPGLVANVIGSVIAGTTYVAESALGTLGAVFANLTTLQLEDAWNAAINGFLGPDGTLGQLVQLTGGIGIVEDVDYEDEGVVPTVVIPSLRSDLTSAAQRLGDLSSYGEGGIRNDPFSPVLTSAAAAVEAPAAAAARAEVAATVDTTAAVETAEAAEAAEVSRPLAGVAADDSIDAATSAAVSSDAAVGDAASTAAAGDNAAPAAAEKSVPSKQKATRKARAAS